MPIKSVKTAYEFNLQEIKDFISDFLSMDLDVDINPEDFVIKTRVSIQHEKIIPGTISMLLNVQSLHVITETFPDTEGEEDGRS